MSKKTIKDINEYKGSTVNPMNYPNTVFELYSVPSFEQNYPEIIKGSEIGSSKVTVQENDVLVCKINPRINRVWKVKHNTEHQLLASSEWIIIRSPQNNADYLKWYFQSPVFRNYMNSALTGIGGSLTRAQPKQVANYPVPLPPLETQKQISATLDKATQTIDLCNAILEKLDLLVKARFVEMFGDKKYPYEELISLIIEGAGLSYGIVQPGDDGTGDMGVLRPVDLVNGSITTDSIKYIDRQIGVGFQKTELTGRELLITVRGTTGITALTDERFSGMNVTRGIAVIRYNATLVNPIYLNAYLQSDESQRYIQENTRGATLKQINLSDLRVQRILVPPLELQNQFAAFVEKTDRTKAAVKQVLAKAETLKKALMQEYFG